MRIDGDRLWIPDYAGNNMYNTLGNLSVNPTTGLLFIDFDTGDTFSSRVSRTSTSKRSTLRPVAPTARGRSRRPRGRARG